MNRRIENILPILTGGALAAADSLGRKLRSGKNSDQKQSTEKKRNNTKAGRLKRKKRRMQKESRRRNRR